MLRRLWDGPHAHRIRIALLALAVFLLDTIIDINIVIPILYVIVVLLATRSGRRSDVAMAGCGSIGLTVLSLLLTVKPGVPVAATLFNTALSILAIICVTVLCVRSITSQAEILRARDRIALVSRGIFLKTISASVLHEVMQPLTAIGANAQAASRWLNQIPPNLDETRTAAQRIVLEVGRISAVATSLRRSVAPGEIAREACDVASLIETAVDHLRFEIGDAEVEVTLVCARDLAIVAEKMLIEQVIVNALSNSIDALRASNADKRSIVIESKPGPGRRVQISIKDNGPGVDDTTLDRIFDPFFTTKSGTGMGLGLAVSKSIIDAHDGTIRAIPCKPRGLTIEITLPAARPDIS